MNNKLFNQMGYDEETQTILNFVQRRTELSDKSLIILHENMKIHNSDFLDKVNEYIVTKQMKTIQDINNFIVTNNKLMLPITEE